MTYESSTRRQPYMLGGRAVTHDWLLKLWTSGMEQKQNSRKRILAARALRRMHEDSLVKIAPTWSRRHPEAASWVRKVLPIRRTYDRDLIASVGKVEPRYSCEALGFLDRDRDYAEEKEGYLEEWRKQSVPFPTFAGKATEDGEFALTILPSDVDMDGCPDFYDRLDENAYEALEDDQKDEYSPDETDRRKRYVKRDAEGRKTPARRWDRDRYGRRRGSDDRAFERDDDKSKAAHDEVVQRYLLKQEQGASTIRVIPALDCAPAFTRGTRRGRWNLHHLVTRELFYQEELPATFAWQGMGDQALIPQGYADDRTTGQHNQWYLYTLYFPWKDPKTKIEHPIVAYSVGGLPTWDTTSPDPPDAEAVAVLDLHKTHGLCGSFWGYFGGMHTEDDSPDWYWEPAIWPIVETITMQEGVDTSIASAVAVSAFTGHYSRANAALAELDPEAMVDAATGELRKTKIPAPGEIEDTISDVFPAQQAVVGGDAWRLSQANHQELLEATALDQPQGGGTSGHQLVVQSTLSQVAKRHIREGALDATVFCGERHLAILDAVAQKFDVRWPIQTVDKRPVGSEIREGDRILAFDPAWVTDGQYKVTAAYPEEENPLRIQIAEQSYRNGTGTLAELAQAKGIKDTMSFRAELAKDRLWQAPATDAVLQARVAKRSGNKMMLQVLKLQEEQKLTKEGVPGFQKGMPTAAFGRPGQQQQGQGGGGQTAADQMAAGAKSGYMATASRNADAAAQMAVGQQVGAA